MVRTNLTPIHKEYTYTKMHPGVWCVGDCYVDQGTSMLIAVVQHRSDTSAQVTDRHHCLESIH